MNILILGGASPRHKEWVRQLREVLRSRGNNAEFIDYQHWDHGGETDLAHEIAQAASCAATFLGPYVIVAKSIGTVIAVTAVSEGVLHPVGCVFLGFPLAVVRRELPEVLPSLKTLPRTIFVQNEHDPVGTFHDLRLTVTDNAATTNQFIFNELPGDSHDYVDFNLVGQLVTSMSA